MDFHVAEVAVPTDPQAARHPVLDAICQVSAEHHRRELGHVDLADGDPAALAARYADQRSRELVWLVAVRGPRPAGTPDGRFAGIRLVGEAGARGPQADDVLAASTVALPLVDNLEVADTDMVLRTEALGQGVWEALVAAQEQVAAARGRTTVHAWSFSVPTSDDPADLPDPTGAVRVRRDHPEVARRLAAGYRFAQAERHSEQLLPLPEAVLARACDDTRARAAGYGVVQWVGATPEAYLVDKCHLLQAMSTDAPVGGMGFQSQAWDPERVRVDEARALVGLDLVTTAVRHEATGRLVGFTAVVVPHHLPQVGHQEETLVLEGHRGHGLGLLLKARNVRLLLDTHPQVRRVHTWNADENDRMLAINEALGYRLVGIEAAWRKDLA